MLTYNVNICSGVGNGEVFPVVRETYSIDAISENEIYEFSRKRTALVTYSQTVIVLAQIQSFKSNILTIESAPPEARYLPRGSRATAIQPPTWAAGVSRTVNDG